MELGGIAQEAAWGVREVPQGKLSNRVAKLPSKESGQVCHRVLVLLGRLCKVAPEQRWQRRGQAATRVSLLLAAPSLTTK